MPQFKRSILGTEAIARLTALAHQYPELDGLLDDRGDRGIHVRLGRCRRRLNELPPASARDALGAFLNDYLAPEPLPWPAPVANSAHQPPPSEPGTVEPVVEAQPVPAVEDSPKRRRKKEAKRPRRRNRPQRIRAKRAFDALYPDGDPGQAVWPDAVLHADINVWLEQEAKQPGKPPHKPVSLDSALRGVGRRDD
jgi:hypothetical protein